MSIEKGLMTVTIPAGADLSSNQYKLVELASDGEVTTVNAATDKAIGVLQNKPAAAARAASIGVSGVTKVWASSTGTAAIAVGDYLTPLASGKVRADSGAGAHVVCGRALAAVSTGVTAVIPMLITGMGPRST